jgi:hypothetical protein
VPPPTSTSRILPALARSGLVAWAVVHLTLAWICLRLAFGERGAAADQSGALATLAANPGGSALLGLLAVGLGGFAAWQVTEAVRGHTERSAGAERAAYRVVSGGRAVLFGALGVAAARFALGAGQDAASQQRSATADLLGLPGGQLLVGAIGLGVVVIGAVLVYRGATKRFREHLGPVPAAVRHPAEALGVVGYCAKGLVLGIAGALVIAAAVTFDPDKSRGLDAALKTLGGQPFGRAMLVAVAAGLACFGVHSVVDARYRRIR